MKRKTLLLLSKGLVAKLNRSTREMAAINRHAQDQNAEMKGCASFQSCADKPANR